MKFCFVTFLALFLNQLFAQSNEPPTQVSALQAEAAIVPAMGLGLIVCGEMVRPRE